MNCQTMMLRFWPSPVKIRVTFRSSWISCVNNTELIVVLWMMARPNRRFVFCFSCMKLVSRCDIIAVIIVFKYYVFDNISSVLLFFFMCNNSKWCAVCNASSAVSTMISNRRCGLVILSTVEIWIIINVLLVFTWMLWQHSISYYRKYWS